MNSLRAVTALAALLTITVPLTAGNTAPNANELPAEVRQRLERAELLAGLTPVEGPGVFLTLRHSTKMLSGVDPQTLMPQEQDLNAIIAALRTGGAEALAVAGRDGRPERLLATSAARESDSGVVVNGVALEPPYQIYAIGDAAAMERELLREGGVVKKAGLDTLEMIEIHSVPLVSIPAARTAPAPRFARLTAASAQQTLEVPAVAPAEQPATQPVTQSPPSPSPTRPASESPNRPGRTTTPQPGSRNAKAVRLFGGEGYAKYHAPECRLGERIPAAKRVTFRSLEAARKDGRTPCSICLPNGDPGQSEEQMLPH